MKIDSIKIVIDKLKNATECLSTEKQVKLGKWLEDFLAEHDEKILTDVFLRIERDAKQWAKDKLDK